MLIMDYYDIQNDLICMKPLTTEPPLDPPVTEYDRIQARRFELYKKGLLEEEQLNDSLLEQEHQWMQLLEDEQWGG